MFKRDTREQASKGSDAVPSEVELPRLQAKIIAFGFSRSAFAVASASPLSLDDQLLTVSAEEDLAALA
jgi:hypothetical protein